MQYVISDGLKDTGGKAKAKDLSIKAKAKDIQHKPKSLCRCYANLHTVGTYRYSEDQKIGQHVGGFG